VLHQRVLVPLVRRSGESSVLGLHLLTSIAVVSTTLVPSAQHQQQSNTKVIRSQLANSCSEVLKRFSPASSWHVGDAYDRSDIRMSHCCPYLLARAMHHGTAVQRFPVPWCVTVLWTGEPPFDPPTTHSTHASPRRQNPATHLRLNHRSRCHKAAATSPPPQPSKTVQKHPTTCSRGSKPRHRGTPLRTSTPATGDGGWEIRKWMEFEEEGLRG
jgi:hypothetical protein